MLTTTNVRSWLARTLLVATCCCLAWDVPRSALAQERDASTISSTRSSKDAAKDAARNVAQDAEQRELDQIEAALRQQARKWQAARTDAAPDTPEQLQLRKQLRDHLQQAFELKCQLEERQLDELEARLRLLRQRLAERRQRADEVVERRLTELTTPIPAQRVELWAERDKAAVRQDAARASELKGPQVPDGPDGSELQARLAPLLNRYADAKLRVTKLEEEFRKASEKAPELRAALQELKATRETLRPVANEALESLANWRKALHDSVEWGELLQARSESLKRRFAEGESSWNEYQQALAAVQDARRVREQTQQKEAAFRSTIKAPLDELRKGDAWHELTQLESKRWTQEFAPTHPDLALPWVEDMLGLRVEFVDLSPLGLPVTGALRVLRDADGFVRGDLIVRIDQFEFKSLEEVFSILSERRDAWKRTGLSMPFVCVRGGLAGELLTENLFALRPAVVRTLKPSKPTERITFEFYVRDDKGVPQARYSKGVCVAADGLVTATMRKSTLVPDRPIRFHEPFQGTARVVAEDEARGICLLKLDVENRAGERTFSWSAISDAPPLKDQQLNLLTTQRGMTKSLPAGVVVETGVKFSGPVTQNDAFAFQSFAGNVITGNPIRLGEPLMTLTDELQGLVIGGYQEDGTLVDPPSSSNKFLAVPAEHVRTLVETYRQRDRSK